MEESEALRRASDREKERTSQELEEITKRECAREKRRESQETIGRESYKEKRETSLASYDRIGRESDRKKSTNRQTVTREQISTGISTVSEDREHFNKKATRESVNGDVNAALKNTCLDDSVENTSEDLVREYMNTPSATVTKCRSKSKQTFLRTKSGKFASKNVGEIYMHTLFHHPNLLFSLRK